MIADVAEGSAVGAFLNGFVDRYNSQGHDGLFLSDADGAALAAAGLARAAASRRSAREI